MKNWKEVAKYLDDSEADNLLSSLHACGAKADKIGCGPVSLLGFYKYKIVSIIPPPYNTYNTSVYI